MTVSQNAPPPIFDKNIDTKNKYLTKRVSLRKGPGKHFSWKGERKHLSFGSFLVVLKPSTSNTGHFMDRENQ